MAPGASIELGGGREGGGRLIVRADRTAGVELSATVTGARQKLLVGSRVYDAATVDAALVDAFVGDAGAWLASGTAPAGWDRGAGVIVRAGGDLLVAADVDLSRIAGGGYFGLEAGGDLRIEANVSDGFASTAADAALADGQSFDIGLEAGGDIALGELIERLPPTVIAGGQPLDRARALTDILPVTPAAAWQMPSSISAAQSSTGQWYYGSWGFPYNVVPAGVTLVAINGNLPAGYVVPADAFPGGLTFPGDLPPFTGTGRIVRTGTGDIAVRAGRDLKLGNESVTYTAGRRTAAAPGFDTSAYVDRKVNDSDRVLGEFPTLGGNVSLKAGRDIVSPLVAQSPSAWLFRHGAADWTGDPRNSILREQTSWSIVYRNFQHGVGALGGGNVDVRAGRDVVDLAVALPTTGHLTSAVGGIGNASDLVVRGGGDLALRAGGDLRGGAFVLGGGDARIAAGGAIGEGQIADIVVQNYFATNPGTQKRGHNPLFGLMDGVVELRAARDVTIEGVYDLMMQPQLCENLPGACSTGTGNTSTTATGSAFVGYSARAAISGLSAGGDVSYLNNAWAATALTRDNRNAAFRIRPPQPPTGPSVPTGYLAVSTYAPGTFELAALSGDISLPNSRDIRLSAAPSGTLRLLAAGDIDLRMNNLVLDDTGTAYIRNALAPLTAQGVTTVSILLDPWRDTNATVGNNFYRGYELLHADDPEPLRIVALAGSIRNGAEIYSSWILTSPKPVDIYAGTDLLRPILEITHADAAGISTVHAGRDIIVDRGRMTILGAGNLWVEAGRNWDPLSGNGSAVRSLGNAASLASDPYNAIRTNHALADVGADINLLAGTAQGADHAGFAALYLDPANLANPEFGLSHPTNQGKVVHTYEKELEDWLAGRGFDEVTADNRLALFASLPETARRDFLNDVLLQELRETGIDYNDPSSRRFQQYTRGYSALHLMFPAAADLDRSMNPLGGDIFVRTGMIESRSGGSIDLIAPYGQIALGNPLAEYIALDSAGVLTRRGGNISLLANNTISLDRSRIFTLQGGDVLMWTSNGDITAGIGAKTNVSNVPLSFVSDVAGRIGINVFGLSTGAGIGVLDAFEGRDPDRRPSRMDLLAFFGEVNAGDAGIRVVGDINIAALRVVNAANIEVSGDAVGIPQVPAVNVGALNAASAATSAIVNEAAQLAERSRPQVRTEIPTIVTVTFAGFGE
nr:filamentous haemagglutinin family protein [Sandaracinobacteroides sayramensis]